jgi:NADPH:quinone reductase-like Zn-dependent oxidoreductase
MKAVVRYRYGSPEVLELVDLPTPIPKPLEVVVEIRSVSLNLSDWENLTARPAYARVAGIFKPRNPLLGTDIAGVVTAIGSGVSRFEIGDAVFGDVLGGNGGFAEFGAFREGLLTAKPDSITFEQASALLQAFTIAQQGIEIGGKLEPGQQVLINGGGGGSGSFAIQLAKLAGAEVTAVDNTSKLEFMTSLGADYVIDYTKEDFAKSGNTYDVILDLVATRPARAVGRALKPGGAYRAVGGSVPKLIGLVALGRLVRGRDIGVLGLRSNEGLERGIQLVSSGQLKVIIDSTHTLDMVPEAIKRIGTGQSLGKVIVTP